MELKKSFYISQNNEAGINEKVKGHTLHINHHI